MARRQTRRRYLLAVGAVGTAALAGCAESESDADSGDADDADDDGESTPAGTASTDDGATPTDDDSTTQTDTDRGPEATFRQYLEAYADGDRATVASLTHPASELGDETEEVELTLTEVERTTLSEIAESESIELTESELADARGAIDDDVDRSGAEEYAMVRFTAETDQYGEETGYALLVRDDGQWYVYGMVLTYLYGAQESDST